MNKKIRVLQFPVRNTGGGITQYALNNWKYIDKDRFVFDFATCDKRLDFEEELLLQGCGVHYISCYAEHDFERFCSDFYRILNNDYDVVHLHTSFWKSFAVEELCREKCIPVVIVHSHNSDLGGLQKDADRELVLKLHNQRKKNFSEELATHFCACSRAAADWLFGDRIPLDKIKIMPNAIDVSKFAFQPDVRAEYRNVLGLNGKFVIGHVGRFEYQKNHDFLIDVFAEVTKKVPNAVLLSVGDGELLIDIRRKVEYLGISDRVMFLGKSSFVSDLYQAMDCFVLTSRFEGLAIVLVEAQCAGLFTVTTETTIPENKITDNLMGLPYDVNLWKDTLVKAANCEYERRDCSLKVARSGYSIIEQIRQLEAIYGESII